MIAPQDANIPRLADEPGEIDRLLGGTSSPLGASQTNSTYEVEEGVDGGDPAWFLLV